LGLIALLVLRASPIGADWPHLVRAVGFGLIGGGVYVIALMVLDRPFWGKIAAAFRPDPVQQGAVS
jgi:hypothetical protein